MRISLVEGEQGRVTFALQLCVLKFHLLISIFLVKDSSECVIHQWCNQNRLLAPFNYKATCAPLELIPTQIFEQHLAYVVSLKGYPNTLEKFFVFIIRILDFGQSVLLLECCFVYNAAELVAARFCL